ncbi:MAG: hypothetical protein ACODAU_13785, partial [Myxococcota bacterium]
MTERRDYLAAAVELYLALPGAPRRASRSDWAIAATLYDRGVPLETLAHVLRLATLRRAQPLSPLEPVHSLAYYRQVLDHLTPDALDPGYIDYVAAKYLARFGDSAARPSHRALPDRQNPA